MDLGEEVEELRVEAVVAEVVRLRLRRGGGRRERDSSRSTHGRRSLLPHRDSALSVTRILCTCAVQCGASQLLRQGLICNGGKEKTRALSVSAIWDLEKKQRSRRTYERFLGRAHSNRFMGPSFYHA